MNLLLTSVNWATVGIALAIVAALAVVFAVLIVLVSKICAVKENPDVEFVKEKLAQANCGGCGFAGCADFAKALAEGKADLSMCGPTPAENKAEIAKRLNLEYSAGAASCAVVHCAGGIVCLDKFNYMGDKGCAQQNNYMGGKKACSFGCLGDGTCAQSCNYNAIKVVDEVAVTDTDLCVACGLCVKKCPKRLISFVPKNVGVYIACSSECKGKEVMGACKAGCIGCGLCAKNCPSGAITMVNNLPVIDYDKCTSCKTCVAKCPRKCIKTF